MRKLRALLLMLFAVLALTVSVSATDSNAFFNAHAGECAPDGGSYILNGPQGYVSVLDAPDGAVQSRLCNEQTVTVYGIWSNGRARWAQLRYTPRARGIAKSDILGEKIGWLDMKELVRVYTKQDFIAEHYEEFEIYPVTLTVKKEEPVSLWPYPGSGGQHGELGWYLTADEAVLDFSHCWTDPLGNRWGAVSYGEADGFICLDELDLEDNRLPGAAAEPVLIPAIAAELLPAIPEPEAEHSSLLPYLALSIAAACISLSLLLRQRKNKVTEELQ